MRSTLLIGFAAGLASALLVASIVSGSVLAMLLVQLAPLPILLAGLGWGHFAALAAALVAGGTLATLSLTLAPAYLVSIGGPAWWLSYLALLARPAGGDAGGETQSFEWYPVGRLVLWACGMGALIVAAAIPMLGHDEASVLETLRSQYARIADILARTQPNAQIQGQDAAALRDFLLMLVLPIAAIMSTLLQLFNLWLAGRIVLMSGRLARPWPDVAAMAFPTGMLVALAVLLAATFLPDLAGLVANIAVSALLVAFTVLGFAVLHMVTRGRPFRFLILTGVYVVVGSFAGLILFIVVLGIAEAAFGLRRRLGYPSPEPG